MKKLFFCLLLGLLTSATLFAQAKASNNSLTFSRVPIDGTKAQVVKALEAEGFEYLELYDYLTGMFNGERVKLRISTNHGIVDRILVEYPRCSEENDTRVKYNVLLSRFNRSEKYVCVNPRAEVPTAEDLYWMLQEDSKYYDAVYFYLNPGINADQWVNSYKAEYQKLYNRPLKGLSYEEMEEALFCLPSSLSSAVSGVVWFTLISSHEININYINFKNRPRGEDL